MDEGSEEPQQFSPVSIRRKLFLDAGGVSSINNFASSVQRSVNYLSTSFEHKPQSVLALRASIDEDTEQINGEPSYLQQYNTDNGLFPVFSGESTVSETTPSLRSVRHTNYRSVDEPPAIKIIATDDEVLVISNKSTSAQTIFNSINVLIGLGILSMPFALHLSGWILGVTCIMLSALSTNRTAILLGRILEKYPFLKTYQDIGIFCFGERIGFVILVIFTLDLLGAGISMILLFADSFNALDPGLSKTSLKIAITSSLVILNFLPLRLLSFLSLTGITCTSIVCLVLGISGCIKKSSPGSLFAIMPTNAWPTSTVDFFFALGLYMAPWGGHATFPEIYRDQLHPQKFDYCMKYSFSFSFAINLLTGALGFLMFGNLVDDEITKSILMSDGYPRWISTLIVILMGILPVSKLPLISRPIVTILDTSLGETSIQKLLNRILLSGVFLVSSTVLTDFGKVMSLLGSLICFTVCLTLPALYYLVAFPDISTSQKLLWRSVVALGIFGAVVGTIAVVLK